MAKNLWRKGLMQTGNESLNYKCNKDVNRYIGGHIIRPTLFLVKDYNLIHSGVDPSGKAPRSSWTTLNTSF